MAEENDTRQPNPEAVDLHPHCSPECRIVFITQSDKNIIIDALCHASSDMQTYAKGLRDHGFTQHSIHIQFIADRYTQVMERLQANDQMRDRHLEQTQPEKMISK